MVIVMFGMIINLAHAQITIYSSDFESDDGGWKSKGFGDWEYGMYDFANYTGAFTPPPAANSGDFLWATILNGDYTNSGDTSVLSQDFDLTGYVSAEMKFASWAEVFFSFDTAQLLVNGDLLYERDTSAAPTAWEEITVDLTPYAGDIAQVKFELLASTVVNRAGWYVDDVTIMGAPIPEPTSMSLAFLGMGFLFGLVRRCRRSRHNHVKIVFVLIRQQATHQSPFTATWRVFIWRSAVMTGTSTMICPNAWARPAFPSTCPVSLSMRIRVPERPRWLPIATTVVQQPIYRRHKYGSAVMVRSSSLRMKSTRLPGRPSAAAPARSH